MVVLYMAREEKLTHAPEQHASKTSILRAQDLALLFRFCGFCGFCGFYPGKTFEQQTAHQISHITARVMTIYFSIRFSVSTP